jgi:short-subunit dehydrogenase
LRVILISGANGGLGRATAQAFLEKQKDTEGDMTISRTVYVYASANIDDDGCNK